MGSMFKDMKKFANARGWDYEEMNSGNLRWTHPMARKAVVTSKHPGDHRAILNFKADIKRIERDYGINTVEVEEVRVRVPWDKGLQAIKDAQTKPSVVSIEEIPEPESDPYDVKVERKLDVPLLQHAIVQPTVPAGRTTPTGRPWRPRTEDFVVGIGKLKNGSVRQTISATCCACGAVKDVFTHSAPGEPLQPNSQLAAAFRAHNWRVGVKRSDDMCPDCVKLEEETRPDAPSTPAPKPPSPAPAPAKEPEYAWAAGDSGSVIAPKSEPAQQETKPEPSVAETMTAMTQPSPPVAVTTMAPPTPPVTMTTYQPKKTFEERIVELNVSSHRRVELAQEKLDAEELQQKALWRKIMRAIDRAYVDAKTGYVTGESDAAIAKRFGVLTSEVAAYRAEHFGPELADSVTRDIARDMAGLKRDLKNFQANVIEAAAALETRIQNVLSKIDKAPEAAKHVIEHRKNSLNGHANGVASEHANGEAHTH